MSYQVTINGKTETSTPESVKIGDRVHLRIWSNSRHMASGYGKPFTDATGVVTECDGSDGETLYLALNDEVSGKRVSCSFALDFLEDNDRFCIQILN